MAECRVLSNKQNLSRSYVHVTNKGTSSDNDHYWPGILNHSSISLKVSMLKSLEGKTHSRLEP